MPGERVERRETGIERDGEGRKRVERGIKGERGWKGRQGERGWREGR